MPPGKEIDCACLACCSGTETVPPAFAAGLAWGWALSAFLAPDPPDLAALDAAAAHGKRAGRSRTKGSAPRSVPARSEWLLNLSASVHYCVVLRYRISLRVVSVQKLSQATFAQGPLQDTT